MALLLMGAAPAAPVVPGAPVSADAVVAAIGFTIVPRSVYVAYRAAFAAEHPPAVALQKLIDDRLLAIEARRYALAPVAGELEAARALNPLPDGFAPSEWDEVLQVRILAKRFLDFRFGDFVPIPREEIRALIGAYPKVFKGPQEADEAKARALLLPAARSKREDAFLEELRARVPVRIVPEALPRE